MNGFRLDATLVLRGLARRPMAVAGAAISLGLGFAAQIVVLSCVNAVLWRPLPVPAAGRVVTIYGHSKTIGTLTNIAYPQLAAMRDLDVFDSMDAFTRLQLVWESEQSAEQINLEMVSETYFDSLRPALELGAPPKEAGDVLLGHDFWRNRFGAARDVIGRTIALSGERYTITGVMGPEFRGSLQDYLGNPKVWITLRSQNMLPFFREGDLRRDWVMNWFVGVARLRAGVSIQQARQAVAAMEARTPAPVGATPRTARIFSATRANFHPEAKARVDRTLALCTALASLLLLLGCLNAGLFLLGKALAEARQTTMEHALGPGTLRIARRRFAEAAFVCGLAVLLGTALSAVWIRVLEAYPPPLASIVVRPAWDWRVWSLTAVFTAAAILIAAAAPAVLSIRRRQSSIHTTASGSSRLARRFRESLVGVQIALAAVILAATGLVLRTLTAAHAVDLGFDAAELVMAEVDLYSRGVNADQRRQIMSEALTRLRNRPEVRDAAVSSLMPLTIFRMPARVQVPAGGSVPVYSNAVSDTYFDTLRLPIVQGRVFAPGPAGTAEVVVNQTMARLLDTRGDVLGKTLAVLDEDAKIKARLTVTGIARDAKYHTLWQERIPYFYVSTEAGAGRAIIVRARSSQHRAWTAIRDTMRDVFPSAIVAPPRTGANQLDTLIREQSYLAAFFAALGAIALAVAAAGLMAALNLMVSHRTREIGIRQSLGATRVRILRSVIVRGLAVACGGLLAGAAVAWRIEKLLRPLAPGTPEGDLLPLVLTAFLLLAVAAASTLGPAFRAARIEPWSAIRHPE